MSWSLENFVSQKVLENMSLQLTQTLLTLHASNSNANGNKTRHQISVQFKPKVFTISSWKNYWLLSLLCNPLHRSKFVNYICIEQCCHYSAKNYRRIRFIQLNFNWSHFKLLTTATNFTRWLRTFTPTTSIHSSEAQSIDLTNGQF